MRILFTLHYPLDPNAGAAGYTLRLAEALREIGNEVEVLGATRMFERLGKRAAELAFPFAATARSVRELQANRFDVVDASTGDLWPCPSRLLQRVPGITVTRSHGLEHHESQELLKAVERGEMQVRRRYFVYYGGLHLRQVARSLRVADGAVFCNESNRRFAIERLNVDESRAFFVRAGTADYFLGLAPPSNSAGAGGKIAVIGPYAWVKGATFAASALSDVLRRLPEASATWLGATPDEVLAGIDPDLRERVTVVAKYKNSELPGILRGHHILLALSRAEGFPGAVLEGMACGLAVVASDIPGPRDILAGTGAGVLVPPGDPAAAAKEVGNLLQDRDRLDKFRFKAYEIAQKYPWRDVAEENLNIYRNLLGRKRLRDGS